MAEINGLLNRRRALKLYRGFESLPHRQTVRTREVAQAGSAPGLGPGGRRFESCLPDRALRIFSGLFVFMTIDALNVISNLKYGLFYIHSSKQKR